jgi:hypothetical protein
LPLYLAAGIIGRAGRETEDPMERTCRSGRGAVVAFLWLLAACAPPWQIVRQATPNPFLGQQAFVIAPMSFVNLVVGEKPEAVYLAGKDPAQRGSWDQDKAAMAQHFFESVRGSAQGISIQPGSQGAFVVEPQVSFIEPGFYVGVAARSSEINMVLRIRKGGVLLDEISIGGNVPANLFNPSVGGRLREGASALGGITGRYLVHRTTGQPQ